MHAPPRSHRARAVGMCAVLAALLAAGCDRRPSAPAAFTAPASPQPSAEGAFELRTNCAALDGGALRFRRHTIAPAGFAFDLLDAPGLFEARDDPEGLITSIPPTARAGWLSQPTRVVVLALRYDITATLDVWRNEFGPSAPEPGVLSTERGAMICGHPARTQEATVPAWTEADNGRPRTVAMPGGGTTTNTAWRTPHPAMVHGVVAFQHHGLAALAMWSTEQPESEAARCVREHFLASMDCQ